MGKATKKNNCEPKKNTCEPKKKTLKNKTDLEQSGGELEELKNVFIEDINDWKPEAKYATYFTEQSVDTIVASYREKKPVLPVSLTHEHILPILDTEIQSHLFLWGANANNHFIPFNALLGGGGQAGERAPYKHNGKAVSHPNYLGIITTQYKLAAETPALSTHDQVLADINTKFNYLEEYVNNGGKVHIPRDHEIFNRLPDNISAQAKIDEIQDSHQTIQMGLGTGLAKDQQDDEENYKIQQDLLYYRVAKLSVLTLKDKLEHIDDFLKIYAGEDKVQKEALYYSEKQLFLPKEITNSLKKNVKDSGFKNKLFSAVLILPKTYLKNDQTYIPKIKQHLLFRHPIHYGKDNKWDLINENKFTEIFGCSKRLIYEFNAKVRGKLKTTANKTKVCPGDLLIEHLWYGVLGWTDWVYSDSVLTGLSEESEKKKEKKDYDQYRPTKNGAYILHTWGVNLENTNTPHYKFCFSDLGDGKKKITDTLVYSKPNETFHENNYKKLLNNMLNVIQNAITYLSEKHKGTILQVRISKLGFGAWIIQIPPEKRVVLLEYYKYRLLNMYIKGQIVITFIDYENGKCLTSEINPEDSKLQWSKNKTGPYSTDPFGPFIGDDKDVLLLVNAWDDASFIGNGGRLDPTLDGWMVTGDPYDKELGLNGKPLGYYAQNYSYFHNVFFQPQLLHQTNWHAYDTKAAEEGDGAAEAEAAAAAEAEAAAAAEAEAAAAAERAAEARLAEEARLAAEGDGKKATEVVDVVDVVDEAGLGKKAVNGDGKKAANGDGKKAAEVKKKKTAVADGKKKQLDADLQEEAIKGANERARNHAKYFQEHAEAIARGFNTSDEMAKYIEQKQKYIGYEYDTEYTYVNPATKKIESISQKNFLEDLDIHINQLSQEIKENTALQERVQLDARHLANLQAELIMMQTKKNLVTADIKKKLEPKNEYDEELFKKIKDESIKAHHMISVIDIAKAMGNNAKDYYEDMQKNVHVHPDQAASLYLKNRQDKIKELANKYNVDDGEAAKDILNALLISFEIKVNEIEKRENHPLYGKDETTRNPKFEAVAVARGFFTLDEMNSMLEAVISEKDKRTLYKDINDKDINNYYDMIPIYVKTTANDSIQEEIKLLTTSQTSVQKAVDLGKDQAINNAKLKMIRARFEILTAVLEGKKAYGDKDGDKDDAGLISAIKAAFESKSQLSEWKHTIFIAQKIGELKMDDTLNENIKQKVNEMITTSPELADNSILLGLKQVFNLEDPTPPIIAPPPRHIAVDIDDAFVRNPMEGAQHIVAAKKKDPQRPTLEFNVENWLTKVENSKALIAEAEFADLKVDNKYKVHWITWRETQLKQNGWKNMYDLNEWELKKTDIDAKQGREQAEEQERQIAARVAAELQKKKKAPTMLDNILGILGQKPPAEVQRLEQRQKPPAEVQRLEQRQKPPAEVQRSQDPQAIISSMYQEDNSSSYMFYIPIVGILIGISSMFLIK